MLGGPGIARLHFFDTVGEFNVMVTDLLGKNLEELFILCNRRFGLGTTAKLAVELVTTVMHVTPDWVGAYLVAHFFASTALGCIEAG